MKEHNVKVDKQKNKKGVAFVERLNKTLSERLFAYQYDKEMESALTKERNREWVNRLPEVIEALNSKETRLIKLKPIDAIKQQIVEKPIHAFDENLDNKEDPYIQDELKVRYLYKPGEAEQDNRYRATDPIMNVDVYTVDSAIKSDDGIWYYTSWLMNLMKNLKKMFMMSCSC